MIISNYGGDLSSLEFQRYEDALAAKELMKKVEYKGACRSKRSSSGVTEDLL